jgi:hypothetical protein
MKTKLTFLFFAVAIFLSSSCGNSPSSLGKLPPFKIEVPAELKGNKEVVQFIKDSEEAINLYSNTAEKLAEDCKDLVGKNEEDLSMLDKVKMVAALRQFTANFAQFAAKYGEMMEQTKIFEKGLNEEQTAALATVLDAFKNRMEQLEEKYKDYGIENK